MLEDRYAEIRRHTFADVLREHCRSRPHMVGSIEGDVVLTWPQLDARVNRLANALMQRGVAAGDRLLWVGQNSSRLFEVLLAGAKLGASTCPVNWRIATAELTEVIDDFDPQVIFWQEGEIGSQYRDTVAAQAGRRVLCQHDAAGTDGYEGWLADSSDRDPELPVDPASPVLAIYTAAFAGRPNAAMLSHDAMLLQSLISARAQGIVEQSSYLVSGPMFHVGVLMGALATYLVGGKQIFVPRIVAREMAEQIHRHRVTHTYIPQPTIEEMRKLPDIGEYDFSCIFKDGDLNNWCGTMVMPADAPMMTCTLGAYGQTEISGISACTWMGGTGAGRPNPFTQMRIVDDAGNELAAGATGEIAVRGPMVMNGYHNRAEENAARTADGWHRTRDLGKRNEDGSIVFVGPKTTMIKTGVENVYPAEVEACLARHPAVAHSCVIGVPDPKWDQNVKALVVLKPGQAATAQELIEHCRSLLASYKKPKIVEFVEQLPRDASGAVDRKACDAAYGGGGYPNSGVG
jgi:long-chain acyl-CoA synthetase